MEKTENKKINVFNCANFLINAMTKRNLNLNNTKLQKLLYYAQAYHLVKNNQTPLFNEPIEAWDYCAVLFF